MSSLSSNAEKVNIHPEVMNVDDVLNVLRNDLNEGSTILVINPNGEADQAYRLYKFEKVLRVDFSTKEA